MIVIDTANHISALAAKMARARVIAAYPITPQTTVVEKLAEYVESGELDAEFIRVESEHSAMTACIAAEAMGVRTFTATASHGLLLMHEMLHWAGLARLPIVMVNVNRAIGPGWNIWSDANDSMAQRDTGWLHFYCSSNQEVYDSIIMAYKIAESQEVMLPAMICYDGFILSHTSMPVEVPEQSKIDEFLPEFKPAWKIDVENPITHGNIVEPHYYARIRYDMQVAMERAKKIIEEVGEEWGKKFGRDYGLVQEYKCEDADYVILTMASMAAEAKVAVDELRNKGEKVGLVNLRTHRPMPFERLKYDKIIVIERAVSFGLGGIVYNELKGRVPELYGFIAGIGGMDVSYRDIERMYELAKEGKDGWYPIEVK
ncbi:MAG: pyruvate ferredoxin oxidoreductase [Thermoplasmata archaeon]|nr:MAG: pyruvate ferredoxin oxidoreductase [Thermoplasmata archaeon]